MATSLVRAVRVALDRLKADPSLCERTVLSPAEVTSLFTFCLDATYLSYRGGWYRQTFGTAMGSPVSVTVANLVMEDIEERALATCSLHPPFWKRYVDDTLTALPRGQIEQFHQHINSIEPSIQFTIEEESNGSIPFLDTRVIRHDNGSLSTTVFRKQTHTDRYLDFTSHHPLAHKAAVVRTLLARADKVCTFVTDKDAEREHVTRALQNTGYPRSMVDQNRYTTSLPPPPSQEKNQPKAVVTLPYIRHLSESI